MLQLLRHIQTNDIVVKEDKTVWHQEHCFVCNHMKRAPTSGTTTN